MYNIIAKSRTKDAPSGKVYTVTLRKWDIVPLFLEKIMEISWIFHGENVEIYGGFMEILCAFDGKAMEI